MVWQDLPGIRPVRICISRCKGCGNPRMASSGSPCPSCSTSAIPPSLSNPGLDCWRPPTTQPRARYPSVCPHKRLHGATPLFLAAFAQDLTEGYCVRFRCFPLGPIHPVSPRYLNPSDNQRAVRNLGWLLQRRATVDDRDPPPGGVAGPFRRCRRQSRMAGQHGRSPPDWRHCARPFVHGLHRTAS